jgi:putative ABC transport system permease protein
MGIAVTKGRAFTVRDASGSAPVAIVNQAAARKYFAGVDPVGQHLANSRDGVMREVVGVVADVRFDAPNRPVLEELYLPFRQVPWPSMSIAVASRLAPDAVASVLRAEVAGIDPDQAITDIRPMGRLVADTTTQQRFVGGLVGVFAAGATALAAIGLYGVVALFVSQRRHEFSVRLALGAQPRDVIYLVLREGATLVAAGAVVGLIAARISARLIDSLLFRVYASDPGTYAAGVAVLAVIGIAACYLPARRAMAGDVAQVMRAQ